MLQLLKMIYEPRCGDIISDSLDRALELCIQYKCTIEFNHNDTIYAFDYKVLQESFTKQTVGRPL